MSLSRSQRVNIFTDSRWTDWFYLVVCMASSLIFRKQRYSGRRRSYIYPSDSVGSLSHQRWSGVFVARYIALHWPRLGAPVSPLCFADHAVKQSVMHAPCYAAASATPGSQWQKTMLGQSHHGINSYKVRHKQRNRSKRFPIYRLHRPTRWHRNRRRTHKNSPGRDTTGRTRRVSFRLSRCGAYTWLHRPHTGSLWSGGFGLCRWLRTGHLTSSGNTCELWIQFY